MGSARCPDLPSGMFFHPSPDTPRRFLLQSPAVESATREKKGVTIVGLSGRMIAGDDPKTLRSLIKGLIEAGKLSILLDLEKLTYMDSAGLGALMSVYSSARAGAGTLKLLKPGKKVMQALMLTKMYPLFEIFQSEDDAVNSFTAA